MLSVLRRAVIAHRGQEKETASLPFPILPSYDS